MARKRYKPEEIVAKLRQVGRLWLADGSCNEFSHECLARLPSARADELGGKRLLEYPHLHDRV
jgi:hypothetical protein